MCHFLHSTCLNCFAAVGGRRSNGVKVEPGPGCSASHFTTAVPRTLSPSDMAFQINLANEETWAKEITVVEVYQDWCGPCKAVVNTLKKQFFELGERPLKFYMANCKHIAALEKFSGHCEPVFVFYQDGKLLNTVTGANAPVLCTSIDKLSAEAAATVAAKA